MLKENKKKIQETEIRQHEKKILLNNETFKQYI